MNDKLNNNVTIIPPFKRFCMTIGELPTSYTESMTYYESLVWLCNYMQNTLIPAINNNGEAVTELQEKYVELKDYVDNYFENLDIQTEINNKLDAMAESGQLAEIISAYLEMSSVLGYDTKLDLKGATNIISGSICKTLGTGSYQTGDGHFYKIRDLEESDVIDEDNLVALTNYPELVAEKIPEYLYNSLDSRLDTIEETTIPDIQSNVSSLESSLNLLTDDRYILIGDSYSVYRPDTEGIEGWAVPLRRLLDKANDDCYIIQDNGGGFVAQGSTGTFQEGIESLTVTNPETITKIVVCGGLNDMNSTKTSIKNAINTFITYCKTNYPNATVYIGMIGWDDDALYTIDNQYSRYKVINIVLPAYKESTEYGSIYLNGVENIMHDYSEYYDRSHPNQTMCLRLARGIKEALDTGSCSVYYPLHNITFTNANIDLTNFKIKEQIFDNTSVMFDIAQLGSEITYTSNYPTTSNNQFYVGAVNSNYFRNVNTNDPYFTCSVLITDSNNTTYKITGGFYVEFYNYVHFGSADLPNGISIKSIKLYHPYVSVPTSSR